MLHKMSDNEGRVSILVVDRDTQTAVVTTYHLEHLPTLEAVAKALGCPDLVIVAQLVDQDELCNAGWLWTGEETMHKRFVPYGKASAG